MQGEPFAFCPVAHPVQTGGDDRQHINLFPEAPVTVSLECALAQANKARKAGFAVLGQPALEAAVASKVSLGAQLGAYESTRFKNKPKPSPLASLEVGPQAESSNLLWGIGSSPVLGD